MAPFSIPAQAAHPGTQISLGEISRDIAAPSNTTSHRERAGIRGSIEILFRRTDHARECSGCPCKWWWPTPLGLVYLSRL